MKSKKILSIIGAVALLAISSCKKQDDAGSLSGNQTSAKEDMMREGGNNPDENELSQSNNPNARINWGGYVYVGGNETSTNMIHIFRWHGDGSLTYEGNAASGGAGQDSGLGSQGALAMNHHLLFAVNAGGNSISSFDVHADGSLTLLQTVSSGGTNPVSLCCHRDLLYVVNKMSDAITGFRIDAGGNMTPIAGTTQSLSGTGTAPAQISFTPNGDYLLVTEKLTGMITTFPVDASGIAGAGTSIPAAGLTPFGFDYARGKYMVVANAHGDVPNAATVASYNGINTGNLQNLNGAVPNNQTAACWTAITKYGRYAFITNSLSNTISSYYIGSNGDLYLIDGDEVSTGNAPTDLTIAGNFYVYNINAMDGTVSGYRRGFFGSLDPLGATGGLPAHPSGIVSW